METRHMAPCRYLSGDEMERIYRTALQILDHPGMLIDHEQCLEYLHAAGCRIDHSSRHVRFPVGVVESAVARMQRHYADPDRRPRRMSVRYSQARYDSQAFRIHDDFTVSSGGFCCFIRDLDGVRRTASLDDVRASLRLADRLDEVSYTGLPVAAQEIPVSIRPVAMAAELVKHTRKFGGIETFKAADIRYITRIGEIVAGGRDQHRKNPILVGYAEARTPLCLDRVMADIFLEYIRHGLPQSIDTMPNAGATAPMTAAGTLALGLAETLSALVLGYAVDPEATLSLDITPGYCDMRSMLFGYAGAERVPLLAARVQLISEFFGCPSGIHGGKTNACVPGFQAGVEKGISMLGAVLAGAIGFGTVGHLENALTFSPMQLVADCEVARFVRRCVRGIEVSDETLALEEIRRTGIGGSFVASDHTANHFRDELLLSPFFDVPAWGMGDSLESDRFEKRATEMARDLMKDDGVCRLTPAQHAEIGDVIREAVDELCPGWDPGPLLD